MESNKTVRMLGLLSVLVFLNIVASLGWLREVATPHESVQVYSGPMTKVTTTEKSPPWLVWEYHTSFMSDTGSVDPVTLMNTMGSLGWEAYSIRRANDGGNLWGTEVMYRRHR